MSPIQVRHGAATDVGLVRESNQDAHLVAPPVFVVADGMGGHHGGDVASGIVAEEFARLGGGAYDLAAGAGAVASTLVDCQRRIHEFAAAEQPGEPAEWYAGTTVVVALLVEHDDGPAWLLANLGDSRVYRLLGDRLQQISVDHSLVQAMVDAGQITAAEAVVHPNRNIVTRALGGPDEDVGADYFLVPLAAADRLLLCTDGVTEMLDDDTIGALMIAHPEPEQAARRLVEAAVAAGGLDNATAVVVGVAEP